MIQGYFPHGPRISPAAVTERAMPDWARSRVAQLQARQPSRAAAPVQTRPTPTGTSQSLPQHLARFPTAGGQPLPAAVRQRMEAAFATSFSDVRIHVGSHAVSIGAAAFTHGANIYFAPGQYAPQAHHGQHILAHELAHVVQQRSGRVRNPFGFGVALVQDRMLENEADAMAHRAILTPVVQRAAAAVVVYQTPQATHDYICATYGTGAHKDGTAFRLWGGEGISVEETDGSRKFDEFRDEVDRLGTENGCHTCGRYQGDDTPPNANTGNAMKHWVCDHQPPLGIIPDADAWRLYPQCHECSNAQHGRSIIYVNAFKKHVGRPPDKQDQHMFWGEGRVHRARAKYDINYKV